VTSIATSAADFVWDGLVHSYRPRDDWRTRVSPKLKLATDAVDDIDPVTFEVLRNRLWTINIAHGDTLTRMSGSPVFQGLDFNMSILTEDGEAVMSAPFVQYLNAGAPLVVRYLMEHFSDAPGIEEGDVYLASDPWIGASHQMDVCVAAPLFIDGKLFAWVSNAAHQYDLGGIVPGGWPQNAPDVYSDPVMFRPFKLIERGVLRDDLEQMYRRQSRLPDMVALDMRAQLAGCQFAIRRLRETCDEFGPGVVKAAMRRILENAQLAFARKLERIPDCTVSDVFYFDEEMPGDRKTHRVQFNLTKRGDRLIVDNEGTDAQGIGPNGFTFVNFMGIVLGLSALTLLHEHTFSVGGAYRQIDFRPTPGTLTCCDYPAAVSGGVMNIISSFVRVQNSLARLMACDPELKRDLVVCGADHPLLVLAGADDRGNFFGTAVLEAVGAGGGSRAHADGVNTAGLVIAPMSKMPNVEDTEQYYPMLMMYRTEATDTGGPGRYRGGVGIEVAFTPYRSAQVEAITNAGGQGVSTNQAMGLFGGLPSPTAQYHVLGGTDVAEHWKTQHMPRSVAELTYGEYHRLRTKSNGTPLATGDVMKMVCCGGGGYGDPIEREPDRVADDVAAGYVSAASGFTVYGVALRDDGRVDGEATRARREEIRSERRTWTPVAERFGRPGDESFTAATGEPPRFVHEYVTARDDAGRRRVLACARCDMVLSDYRASYKDGLLVSETGVEILPRVEDPSFFLDEDMVLRRYCCPCCQVLMTVEIARRCEPALNEITFL
jgi:N-methylhydantoinase B